MKFCWHKWGRWGRLVDTSTGFGKYQYAKCEKCNAVTKRYLYFNNSQNALTIEKSLEDV